MAASSSTRTDKRVRPSASATIGQTLEGSFSAVLKPNFASKYSLESSRRDLHNALLCTVLESNASFATLNFSFKKLLNSLLFASFCQTLLDLPKFAGIWPEFAEICRNSKSRRIRTHLEVSGTHPEVSGIGTSSAEICMRLADPLLASSSAQPAAALRDRRGERLFII